MANLAVLQAFLATAQRSIEAAGGDSQLDNFDFADAISGCRGAIFWRLALHDGRRRDCARACPVLPASHLSARRNRRHGVRPGHGAGQILECAGSRRWCLLILVHAGQNDGEVALFAALGEFARRWFWLGGAAVVLGITYIGLGFVQGFVRGRDLEFLADCPTRHSSSRTWSISSSSSALPCCGCG